MLLEVQADAALRDALGRLGVALVVVADEGHHGDGHLALVELIHQLLGDEGTVGLLAAAATDRLVVVSINGLPLI